MESTKVFAELLPMSMLSGYTLQYIAIYHLELLIMDVFAAFS